MVSEATRDAFYEGRRTEALPLAVNDVVIVKEGRKNGAIAWVISIEAADPTPKYLMEYEDGSDAIVALAHLQRT